MRRILVGFCNLLKDLYVRVCFKVFNMRANKRVQMLSEEEREELARKGRELEKQVKERVKTLFSEDLSFCLDYMKEFLKDKDASMKFFFTEGLNIFLDTQNIEKVDIALGNENMYEDKFNLLKDRYGVRPRKYVYPFLIWCSIIENCIDNRSIDAPTLFNEISSIFSSGLENFEDYFNFVYSITVTGHLKPAGGCQ